MTVCTVLRAPRVTVSRRGLPHCPEPTFWETDSMIELPDLVTGGLAVGMLSALALGGLLLRAQRQQARQRAEIGRLRARLDETVRALTDEVEHLAARRLPPAARRQTQANVAVPGPLHPQTSGTPLGLALEHVLDALRTELTAQRTRIDAAAQAGMRGATREIQAALYRLQDALRGLQQRYDDPELTQTLFQLDHENEQSLRRAQVAAVVCGAWVGLAREESHLVDAVTGGQARLAGYHRVRVHNHLEAGTALVSHAVEPVAIIVAELLDNALRHSAPDTDVVVNLEHVHHGVCVTVDDAGLGMTQDERARAQRLVAGSEPILLTDLGDPPRMGLAAIGQLTRQFDLGVDLSSPSPYGGVRAVLRVDSRLLGHIDPEERPPAASAPRSTRPSPRPERATAPGPESTGPSSEGDPRSTDPATAPGPRSTDPATVPGPRSTGPSSEDDRADSAHAYGSDRPDDDTGSGHRDSGDTGGLPRRRRRTRVTTASDEPAVPRPAAHRPDQAAAALGALQAGTAAARSAGGGSGEGAEPTAREGEGTAPPVPAHPTGTTARTGTTETTGRTNVPDPTDLIAPAGRTDGIGSTDRTEPSTRSASTDRPDATDPTDRTDTTSRADATHHSNRATGTDRPDTTHPTGTTARPAPTDPTGTTARSAPADPADRTGATHVTGPTDHELTDHEGGTAR